MPRRTILTDRQRSALFDLPVDEPSLRKHYKGIRQIGAILHAKRSVSDER